MNPVSKTTWIVVAILAAIVLIAVMVLRRSSS